MEQNRRMKWKLTGIVAGLLILCILRYAAGIREEDLPAEDQIPAQESEYLFNVLRLAAEEKGEREAVEQAIASDFADPAMERDLFFNTYMRFVREQGLEDKIYETSFLPIAYQENRIYGADQSYRIDRENPALQEDVWPDIRYRDVQAIVWRQGEEDGRELLTLVACRVREQETVLKNVWVKEAGEKSASCFLQDVSFTVPFVQPGDTGEREEKTAGTESTDAKSSDTESADVKQADTVPGEEYQTVTERETVADLYFVEGKLQRMETKKEKVTGRLLRRPEGQIEIEGQGMYPVSEDFQGYRLYNILQTYELEEIPIGYSYADYVIENGQVCAALLRQEETMESVRVLLKAANYEGIYHDEVTVAGEGNLKIEYAEGLEVHPAGESVTITPDSSYFDKGDRIRVYTEALTDRVVAGSIVRSQGAPSYHGVLEIVREKEGLYVINEVLLEEYLYAVVPSEMPASYPMEALKAQSICARTYAYQRILTAGLPAYGAHVDDSTSYQVYNNISEQERTTQAVKETNGQLLYVGEDLAGTYYYSTSCGYGTDAGIWKTSEAEQLFYLQPRHIAPLENEEKVAPEALANETVFRNWLAQTGTADFEKEEPWYRWTYTVEELDPGLLTERLKERQKSSPKQILVWDGNAFSQGEVKDLGDILDIRIEERRSGGIADELVIEGSRQTVKAVSEYNVRYILCNGSARVVRQDGSQTGAGSLLPSAFLIIDTGKEEGIVVGYRLIGGGYGHGVGMSQNGAAGMAKSGMQAEDILTFFYEGGLIREIY